MEIVNSMGNVYIGGGQWEQLHAAWTEEMIGMDVCRIKVGQAHAHPWLRHWLGVGFG